MESRRGFYKKVFLFLVLSLCLLCIPQSVAKKLYNCSEKNLDYEFGRDLCLNNCPDDRCNERTCQCKEPVSCSGGKGIKDKDIEKQYCKNDCEHGNCNYVTCQCTLEIVSCSGGKGIEDREKQYCKDDCPNGGICNYTTCQCMEPVSCSGGKGIKDIEKQFCKEDCPGGLIECNYVTCQCKEPVNCSGGKGVKDAEKQRCNNDCPDKKCNFRTCQCMEIVSCSGGKGIEDREKQYCKDDCPDAPGECNTWTCQCREPVNCSEGKEIKDREKQYCKDDCPGYCDLEKCRCSGQSCRQNTSGKRLPGIQCIDDCEKNSSETCDPDTCTCKGSCQARTDLLAGGKVIEAGGTGPRRSGLQCYDDCAKAGEGCGTYHCRCTECPEFKDAKNPKGLCTLICAVDQDCVIDDQGRCACKVPRKCTEGLAPQGKWEYCRDDCIKGLGETCNEKTCSCERSCQWSTDHHEPSPREGLQCKDDCTDSAFCDTKECRCKPKEEPFCGDGKVTPPEECDTNPTGCESDEVCKDDCTGCTTCGNGVIDSDEDCDYGDPETAQCTPNGFVCTSDCACQACGSTEVPISLEASSECEYCGSGKETTTLCKEPGLLRCTQDTPATNDDTYACDCPGFPADCKPCKCGAMTGNSPCGPPIQKSECLGAKAASGGSSSSA